MKSEGPIRTYSSRNSLFRQVLLPRKEVQSSSTALNLQTSSELGIKLQPTTNNDGVHGPDRV